MKIKVSLFLTVILLSLQGHSQTNWSLEDCINYAIANNLQVKRQMLQAEIADNNYLQSYLQIAPSINAGAGTDKIFGRQVNPYTNTFNQNNSRNDNFGVDLSLNLFNGLQTYNTIQKNRFAQLAALQGVEQEKMQLKLDIATAYLNILFKQELLGINQRQIEITSLQIERTQKLVDAGSSAKGDLLDIKSQYASEMLNVTTAQNDINLAYLNLTQLLDLDSVGNFKIYMADTIQANIISQIVSANEVYNDALGYLPQIKGAEYEVEISKKDLAIQKGRFYPNLYFTGSWGTGYSSGLRDSSGSTYSYNDQINGNEQKSFRVGLSVPIFNKWQVANSVSNAKVRLFDNEFQLSQAHQQLYKAIQQAHNDAVSAREKYNSAIEAVNSLKESFKYTEQKFNVGIVNSYEYNVSKNNLIKAESDLLQAKYQYIFSVKILDFYRGNILR